jgi:carbohydrate-selective porin OprB
LQIAATSAKGGKLTNLAESSAKIKKAYIKQTSPSIDGGRDSMKTTLTDGEMISMATLAAAANAQKSAESYFELWLQLCARLQQNKIASAERIKG